MICYLIIDDYYRVYRFNYFYVEWESSICLFLNRYEFIYIYMCYNIMWKEVMNLKDVKGRYKRKFWLVKKEGENGWIIFKVVKNLKMKKNDFYKEILWFFGLIYKFYNIKW